MRHRDLERHLREHGCVLHHHGRRHDVWLNPRSLAQAPVPRHREVKSGTVRAICNQLGVPTPPRP